MYIPEKLKLNKFKQVSMPSARDYFKLTGEKEMAAGNYSGDDFAPVDKNKAEQFEDFLRYCEMKQKEEDNNNNNPKTVD